MLAKKNFWGLKMASYGFSADHINLIADNLRDRYKNGFPIIKELIQNADDAKAKKLVFGLHPGFKDHVKHALLQGPGLWVFNDGKFKSEDQKAIRSFGLNSKAGDSGSIGKFGLGMKSVFHLCEAFFYIAFDGEKNIDVLLNPWDENNDDDMHRDWKQVAPNEFDAIRNVAIDKKLIDGCATWFLLWIPLRQKAHVLQEGSEYSVAIIDKYPGDVEATDLKFLSDTGLGKKIRLILPILKNLETIELLDSQQEEAKFDGFKVKIAIDNASRRVDHISANLLSIGTVSGGTSSKEKLHFRIQQKTLVEAEPFSKFKQLNAWPKMGSLNKLGKRESVVDKSDAEGVVMISSAASDGERAALDIHWAVFLPTEEGISYKFLIDGSKKSYRIVLHGQFFVDAGRRGIAGARHLADKLVMPAEDLDDTDLHTGWNQAIAQQVVLPMLLPTLAKYAQDNLSASETEELARSILFASTASNFATGMGKKFWDTFKNFICDGQAWVRIITPEGLKWSYEKIEPNTRLLKLPPPPKHDPMRAWKVLPHLKKLSADGYVLLDEDAPSLFLNPSNWDEKIMLNMLQSINYDEVCSETGMAYLEKFLSMEQCRYINSSEVQRALIALLKKMLRNEPLKTFRNARSTFHGLVSLINSEYRFSIGTKKLSATTSLDDDTFKLLINADINKLFLPMDLDSELNSASKGKPDQDEIRILFKLIDKEILGNINSSAIGSTDQVEVFLRAAQMILNLLPEKSDERGQAVRVNRTLKILSATCARTHKKQAVSFDDLHHAHENGLVFKEGFGAGVGAMYSTAIAFSKLIPTAQVWVISGEVAEWIDRGDGKNNSGIPSATDSNAAYQSLGKNGKALALASDIQIRCEFIRNQSPTSIKCDEMKRGIRYVLHGSHKHHGDMESSLWINADTEDAVWVKLKRMIEPDSWSLIDTQLAGAIKSDDWSNLKIRKIGQEQVLECMRSDCNLNLIDASKFNQSEINIILKSISHDDLWRNIPLHRDSIGNFGAITDNCYIDSKKIANPVLVSGCRILIASEDKTVGDRQQKIIPSWSHVVTIKRALEQSAPVDYCQLILDTLGCTDEKQLGSLSELRSIKWLPLKQEGLCISPEDVIDLYESLADEIDRLAGECGYCYAGISALSIDVTKHKNYKNLRDLFASGTSALERLGQLMVEADGYLVGEFILPEGEKLKDYIESLAQLKSLPGWAIANMACVATEDEDVINVEKYLLKELFQPIAVDKLVQLLREIPTLGKSKKLTSIFNIYLKQLVAYGIQTKADIASLKLMACNGSWKNAGDLCVGVEGVDSAYLLNKEQAIILGEMVFQGVIKDTVDSANFFTQNSKKNHVQVVKEYFQPWRELMQPAPIGGLLSLLGVSFRKMAIEFLNPHTIDNFIEKIIWNDPSARNNQVWDYQKPGGYLKSVALDMIDFIPNISDAKSILVASLLDAPIFVPSSSSYNSLIIGNITWAGRSTDRHTFILPLRMISDVELKEYDKAKLSGLIRKTCECILKQAYNQRNVDLDVWESLEKSDQLELEVARELILNRLPYDLRNIKATKKNSKLKEALDNLINFEKDRAGKKSNQQNIAEVDQNIVTAKAALATLMCSDHSVQATVLKGIREKVKQNQYNSI